jgi:hypothetical protein
VLCLGRDGAIRPQEGIFDVLGKDFIVDYYEKRSNKGIESISLRPLKDRGATDPEIVSGAVYKRKIKFLPKDVIVDTTILIWQNFTAYITVHEDLFGLL